MTKTQTRSSDEELVSRINEMQPALVDFTQNIMKFKVVSPEADYSEIIKFLQNAYNRIGLDCQIVSCGRERVGELGHKYECPNILARLEGTSSKPTVAFLAHLDTVAAAELQDWKTNPSEPTLVNGKIYGLGAVDARCSLAASYYAAKAILDCGIKLRGNLLLIGASADEVESDRLSWPGTPYLVEEGHSASGWGSPDMVINCESSGLDTIKASFRGRFTFEVEIEGRRAHAGTPHGINAVEKALKFIEAVKSFEVHEHPTLGRDELFIYSVRAGEDGHIDIPGHCYVGFDIRFIDGYGDERVKSFIKEKIRELQTLDSDFKVRNMQVRRDWTPVSVGPESTLVKAIAKSASRVGITANYSKGLGAGQLYPYIKRGIPCVTYGAGHTSRVHSVNEYVSVDELVNQAKIYALTALELCGFEPRGTSSIQS